jgi:serine/threonine protein kinase
MNMPSGTPPDQVKNDLKGSNSEPLQSRVGNSHKSCTFSVLPPSNAAEKSDGSSHKSCTLSELPSALQQEAFSRQRSDLPTNSSIPQVRRAQLDAASGYPRGASYSMGNFKPVQLTSSSPAGHVEELEDEYSDTDDEEEVRQNFLILHPLHFLGEISEEDETVGNTIRLLRFPDCNMALKLARAVASKHVNGSSAARVEFQEVMGELKSQSDEYPITLSLARSEIGIISEGAQALIAVVPEEHIKNTEVQGWVFTYPKGNLLKDLMQRFRKAGCMFSGLASQYNLMLDGKKWKGAFGTVVRAEAKDGQIVAIKVMERKVKQQSVFKEMAMLNEAQGSPYIIKFHGMFADVRSDNTRRWSLVFDFHCRGDLYDYIVKGPTRREPSALPFLRDLLSALVHLGSRAIFHRDVKPENLLVSVSKQAILTDFGIACHVSNTAAMKESFGSIGYAAPEMLNGENKGCHGDAFGAGVLMYFMLSKSTPFLAPTPELTTQRTLAGHVNLSYGCFEHVSQACRDLMLQLMKVKIEERLTPTEALQSECFTAGTFRTGPSTESTLPPVALMSSEASASLSSNRYGQEESLSTLSVGALPEMRQAPKWHPGKEAKEYWEQQARALFGDKKLKSKSETESKNTLG